VDEKREARARILAIDPGVKRIGLAVSDPLGVTAQGLDTFEVGAGREFFDYLGELVSRYEVARVVVGLPLSMHGADIEGSERARALARRMHERLGIEVVLRDERMTSREAERVLAGSDRRSEKRDVDRLAAVLLLQAYLEEVSTG
jgi:putative Holliday junction resolvase